MTVSLKERDSRYRQRQVRKRRAAMDSLTPNPRTERWLEAEDEIAKRTDINLREKSVMLNRRWSAINSRISLLRRLGPRSGIKCWECGERLFESSCLIEVTERQPGSIRVWLFQSLYEFDQRATVIKNPENPFVRGCVGFCGSDCKSRNSRRNIEGMLSKRSSA